MLIIKNIYDSIASFAKVILLSRKPSKSGNIKDETLIIMGNGPSLRDTLAENFLFLKNVRTLAVNFAANTPAFSDVKPIIYVLADPHFFITDSAEVFSDDNVTALWENIGKVNWEMILYVPCKARIPDFIYKNTYIKIKKYNLTPGEGLKFISHWLYRKGLAMPRPRNVLIASIMVALREGYRDIRIVGADHSWSRDLWVDDKNRVISVQKHFYADNEKEFERVAQEYAGYHLHDILNSLTIAFRSYHQIADYAKSIGAEILNCTPGSYIDAFPRSVLKK